jgi:uncharacterized membrane protein
MSSKKLKTLFTLSVALNVLLLGAAAGFAIKEWREEPWHMAKANMSPQSREMLSQRYQQMHRDMAPLLAEMRKSRDSMRAVMMQDPFDTAKFDQAIARLRSLRQQMGDRMSATTKEIVMNMPSEERRKMADNFVRGFGWKHEKGGHWRCTLQSFGPEKEKPGKPD